MITREQFVTFTAGRGITAGPEIWKTISHLTAKGIVSAEQVTREAFPNLSPKTRSYYRNSLRRLADCEAVA